jgi:glycogen(starch) synthase
VRFLGVLPDEEVPALVAGADVVAFPSHAEGLGLAAAEALMLGVPVVATTDGGGVLDMVKDGEGAFVVPPTVDAMGAALDRCLGNTNVRSAAALAGDRLRHQLSPEAVATRFERVYDQVVRGGA